MLIFSRFTKFNILAQPVGMITIANGKCHQFCRYHVINQSIGQKKCLPDGAKSKVEKLLKSFECIPFKTLNIRSKSYSNPSNSCQDILLKTKNVNLIVALNKVSRIHRMGTRNIKLSSYLTEKMKTFLLLVLKEKLRSVSLDQNGGLTNSDQPIVGLYTTCHF